MIAYGKKRNVPAKCPTCGAGAGPEFPVTLVDLLKKVYGSWNPVLGRHPSPAFRDFPWWYGACGRCTMSTAIYARPCWLPPLP